MVPILHKAISVVRAVAAGEARGSMNRLARDLAIAPASCYRIVQTLERADWVRPREEGGYELSAGLLNLVHPLADVQRMVDRLAETLRALARTTELTVKLSVREGWEAVTVFRADSPRAMALVSRAGARFPLAVGSSGAALCSGLEEADLKRVVAQAEEGAWQHQTPAEFQARVTQAKSQRWCVDRGSFHPQVFTASVPLAGPAGDIVAAVTLIGLPADFSAQALPGLRQELLAVVDVCQQQLAAPHHSDKHTREVA